MSGGAISIKKAIPIIVVTWILSLVTTLALVYVAPSIFPPLGSAIIADEAIVTTKLPDGAVTSAKILDGTITAEDIADGSIIAVKVADGAVTTTKIADASVTASKIADGAIVTIKLADGSVNSAKILDGAVTAVDLADGSVTSIKIADGAVTTTKIADYAVTSLKLAATAIPSNFTHSQGSLEKTTANWENITGMSVTLTLERNSTLLIMFSTEARISLSTEYVRWRAMVNATSAEPGEVYLQPSTTGQLAPISYNFYLESLTAGQYPVYMQWYVTGGATARLEFRTLTVIALPE